MRDIEMRHNTEMEKYNVIILRLQEELTHIRTDIQHSTRVLCWMSVRVREPAQHQGETGGRDRWVQEAAGRRGRLYVSMSSLVDR